MAYIFGTALRKFTSGDGKRYLDILGRHNGLFQFPTYTFTEDGYEYRLPVHISGFYESAEAAEADARRSVPWFREGNSNRDASPVEAP